MSSRDKARVYFAEVNFAGGYIDMLEELLDSHAAESTRETLAAWMIKWGYATGHGDTTEDLLEGLREQIAEGKAAQRQMCVDAVRVEFRALGFPLEPLVIKACLNATGESDEKTPYNYRRPGRSIKRAAADVR